MLSKAKAYLRVALAYLGDAGHRRFVSIAVAIVANHIIGHKLDADTVSTALDVVIGGIGGAWNKDTVKAGS